MSDVGTLMLGALGGYLLGSIPFGLLLTKWAGLGDVRSIGSGNIGATNVLRTGRKDLALATLLLDAGKAGAALWIARMLVTTQSPWWTEIGLVAGGAAFLGHCFPVWLGFKGGKGVATYFGLLLVGMPPLGAAIAVVWVAVAVMFRYSSLAALAAAAAAPLLASIGEYSWTEIALLIALAVFIFWRHGPNIARLRTGAEPRIGDKKEETPAEPAAPAPAPAETTPES